MARQYESKYKFTYRRTNKLTPDTIRKLEEAASFRLNVTESCAHANISRDTYYEWMKKVPGLSDRLDDLRTNPTIRAKRRIVSQIDNDTNTAFRYLEKESPEEYGEKVKLEHSGEMTQRLDDGMHPEDKEAYEEYLRKRKENRHRRADEEEKKKNETGNANQK